MPQARRPKLGQHFLADSGFRRRIADSLNLGGCDLVIEIGAGRGAMTGLLAERAQRVSAIEMDHALASHLQEKYAGDTRVSILQADILSTDLTALCQSCGANQCFIFGNLPYYITSPIIEHLRTHRKVIRGMALLVQREVAERLVATPGSRDYGYLSVFVQLFSQPQLVFTVPPGAFSPPPRVHSALVEFHIAPRIHDLSVAEEEKLLDFVKLCFAQKRKQLINNLSGIIARARLEKELERLGLPANIRAEQMTIEQFATLFGRIT